MPRVSTNTFQKGMNLDASKVVQSKDSAYAIHNFRPWTDGDGKSVGGLVNIEGNDLSFTFPTTTPVFVFTTTYPDSHSGTDDLTITVDATVEVITLDVTGDTNADITESIVDQINADAALQALGVEAFLEGTDTFKLVSNTQGVTFNATEVATYISRTEYLAQQTDVQIIGWTTIRDDFFIFTTNNQTTTGGAGQIWRLQLASVDNAPTLSLVYNDLVNFTIYHPIEAIGRFENDCVKRLYWTDCFNKVRTILIEDDNIHNYSPDSLTVIPILTHSVPVLQGLVNGGSHASGAYQVTYRLKSTSGASTSAAPLSRLFPVISTPEIGTNYWEYIGEDSGVETGKAISVRIENLDTNYDTIEILKLYKSSKNSLPVVTSVVEEPIPTNGTFEYTISGTETNAFEISLEEFLLVNRTFTHAKTLTSKDNRLFVANTRYEGISFDYDEFDPRAYGHLVSSTTFNIDGSAETDFTTIDETADAINDDFDLNKFQQSSTVYGGTGSYISYEIKTKQITADNKELGGDDATGTSDSLPIRIVNDITANPIDLGEGREYPQPSLWEGVKNPYTYEINRGYQRDEIYRFAIVLYDLQGNPGFAHWIADIKIPSAFDPDRSVYGTDDYTNGNFRGRVIEQDSGATYLVNIPYIEFEVDLPATIVNQITGYSIVRVKRTEDDKTILGQGLALKTGPFVEIEASAGPDVSTPMGPLVRGDSYLFGSNSEQYKGSYSNNFNPRSQTNLGDALVDTGGNEIDYKNEYITVQFPEHIYGNTINYRSGDFIKTVDVLGSEDNIYDSTYQYDTGTVQNSIQVWKLYDFNENTGVDVNNLYTANIESNVEAIWSVEKKQEITIDNGYKFRNETYAIHRSDTLEVERHGWGNKTMLIKIETDIHSNSSSTSFTSAPGSGLDDGGTNGATAANNFYIINYKRNILNQYGGNTYTQRGNNSYISTGNFVQVDENYTTQTSEVVGGDTFISIMDSQRYYKSWDFDSDSYSLRRAETTYLFPVESQINTELAHGLRFQSHGNTDNGNASDQERNNELLSGNVSIGESYSYNNVFSAESDTVTFPARPVTLRECTEDFDTRIYGSDPKINGELTDSWASFRTNTFIDLENLYGEINKIYTLNDNFYAFQDRAVAYVAINPRVSTNTSDGDSLELGVGGVLHDYKYLSNSIGCKHQWSVVPSRNHLYWVDINNNKAYRLGSDGIMPLSDSKGTYSFFCKELRNNVRLNKAENGDNPLLKQGITGYYDYKFNEVVFDASGITTEFQTYVLSDTVGAPVAYGEYIEFDKKFYVSNQDFDYDPQIMATYIADGTLKRVNTLPTGFTICYNEFTQSFSSFYTFESPVYMYSPRALFSVDEQSRSDVYEHNVGDRCKFYTHDHDSKIHMYSNDIPVATKVFDNYEWHTESFDPASIIQNQDSFYMLHANTTFQETNYVNLTNNNLKRKERSWQAHVPRSTTNRERLRDKHLETKFLYDNDAGYRFVVHFINTYYRTSFR